MNKDKYYFIKYRDICQFTKQDIENYNAVSEEFLENYEIIEKFEISEEDYLKSDLWIRNHAGEVNYTKLKKKYKDIVK